MKEKLQLDQEKIVRGREAAGRIAADMDAFIAKRTTVAVERTVLRLMGIDGVDAEFVPLPNVVVDHLLEKGQLSIGAAAGVINAGLHYGLTPQQVAEQVATGSLDLTAIPWSGWDSIRREGKRLADAGLDRIVANRRNREDLIRQLGEGKSLIYT